MWEVYANDGLTVRIRRAACLKKQIVQPGEYRVFILTWTRE